MSVDRHRFSKRSRELIERAQIVEDLSRVPDRMTEKDFRLATDLMRGAASDLEELIKATPPGCICRRIENDNYSYLDYAEDCIHHRQYYCLREQLKADYAKMEKALKNEVRMKLVAAALSGTAVPLKHDNPTPDTVVLRALAIADETIRRITEIA
jgi:hypothetical protein